MATPPEVSDEPAPRSEARPEPQPEPESMPEPPKATADLVASLLTPSPRPKIGGAAPAAAKSVAAPSKPKRTPRAKVAPAPEPVTEPVLEVAPAPEPLAEAPAKKKAAPKSKVPVVKAASKPPAETEGDAAAKPKATRAKKPKAE